MKYQVKFPFTFLTAKRQVDLVAGQIIILSEDQAETLLTEGKIITLRQAFEERFKSFSQWLLEHPLNFQTLKENQPAVYQGLMALNREIDRHWLSEDYSSFLEAIGAYKEEHINSIKGCLFCESKSLSSHKEMSND